MSPMENVLERLEHVKRNSNGGYRCECPIGHRSKGTLSITESDDGRVLMQCWAGCSVHEVLREIGLTVSDLFDKPIKANMTPQQKRDLREKAVQPDWRAALSMLEVELDIVVLCAKLLHAGEPLSSTDRMLLKRAHNRILDAKQRLTIKRIK